MTVQRPEWEPPPDPAPEYTEWITHQYDQGHWLGGRIHPLLKRKGDRRGRGNPYGYLLIASAVASGVLGVTLLGDRSPFAALETILLAAVIVLQLAAGLSLIQGRPRPRGARGKRRDASRKASAQRPR